MKDTKKKPTKFAFTQNVMMYLGHTLHEVVALRSFHGVKEGDRGGFIEFTDNLSDTGECWVFPGSIVYGENAIVVGDAILQNSVVGGSVRISEKTKVSNSEIIIEDTKPGADGFAILISGHSVIEDSKISGSKIRISGESKIKTGTIKDNVTIVSSVIDDGSVICCAKINNSSIIGVCFSGGGTTRVDHSKIFGPLTIKGPSSYCGKTIRP